MHSQANQLSETKEIPFDLISVNEGLSHSYITCMIQDQEGFMWFGTLDGLNRYDGFNFKVFRHNENDTTSIANNTISSLYISPDGILWVGTDLGYVNKYRKETNSFESISLNLIKKQDNPIKSFCASGDSIMFIASSLGLYKYNQKKNKVTTVIGENHFNQQSLNITSITMDESGNLYISNKEAQHVLIYFDVENNIAYNFSYQEIPNDHNLSH